MLTTFSPVVIPSTLGEWMVVHAVTTTLYNGVNQVVKDKGRTSTDPGNRILEMRDH